MSNDRYSCTGKGLNDRNNVFSPFKFYGIRSPFFNKTTCIH